MAVRRTKRRYANPFRLAKPTPKDVAAAQKLARRVDEELLRLMEARTVNGDK